MKVRSGFVSNSSSSSFICSVCDYVETGYDDQYSISTTYCYGGHHMCSKHIDKLPLENKKKAILDDSEFVSELDNDSLEAIKIGNEEAIQSAFEDYQDYFDYEVPKSVCPICSLAEIPDWSVLRYLLKQDHRTREQIEQEIRSKYESLDDLRKGLEV